VSVHESGAYSMVLQGVCPFVANFIFGWDAVMGRYAEHPGAEARKEREDFIRKEMEKYNLDTQKKYLLQCRIDKLREEYKYVKGLDEIPRINEFLENMKEFEDKEQNIRTTIEKRSVFEFKMEDFYKKALNKNAYCTSYKIVSRDLNYVISKRKSISVEMALGHMPSISSTHETLNADSHEIINSQKTITTIGKRRFL
jgi:hypothetical protein